MCYYPIPASRYLKSILSLYKGIFGNAGISNSAPWVDLNLGDCSVGGISGSIVFGKNNAGGRNRNFRMGMSSNFFVCVGDCGNVNK